MFSRKISRRKVLTPSINLLDENAALIQGKPDHMTSGKMGAVEADGWQFDNFDDGSLSEC